MALENCDNAAEHIILSILTNPDEPVPPRTCCIYKVPEYLRKGNEDAYTPRLITIGPIHHNNGKLSQMEKQKAKYFRHFRQRLLNVPQQDLEAYTTWLGAQELYIRSYYSEKYPNLDKNEFVRIILLDAVFIMELFLRKWEGEVTADDSLFQNYLIAKTIEQDLFLIENQIPFFVLENLYGFIPARHDERRHSSFLELACSYFETYDPFPGKIDEKHRALKPGWDRPNHFTDLIRSFYIPWHLSYGGRYGFVIIKTATKLKEAGITFKPILERCLLDVKFKKSQVLNSLCCLLWWIKWFQARLQIPKLNVDSSTEYILRNLMAFELCHYPNLHHVCSYVALLNNLIHTKEDVEVLVESKVIDYERGSDEDLAAMINSLGKNIVLNSTCYGILRRDLVKYVNKWNKTWALLKLVYFPDPWRGTGTFVGFVIFVFAVIEVYKAIHELRSS